MKQIPLTQGKYAIVDDEDFEYLSKFKWCVSENNCSGKFYAQRRSDKASGLKVISMHRLLSKANVGEVVDHINGNSIDNRKSNLRTCSIAENSRNANRPVNNTSGYKGVYWDKSKNKWTAQIKFEKATIPLGRYHDIIEAAKAYNAAAIKYHGEFANLNQIPA